MAMWSDDYRSYNLARAVAGPRDVVLALGVGVVGLLVIVAELVLAVQVITEEFTSLRGSWLMALVGIVLGIAGPASSRWRIGARPLEAQPWPRKVLSTGLMASVVGVIAVAWLLLIKSSMPPTIHMFPNFF
jgi:H+/Cl- antiporter ClcA